jgi:hypothetical protein
MSGSQCSDFGGTDLGPSLCTMPVGHAYEGLITYRDGRTAEIRKTEGGNVVFAGPNGKGDITIADLEKDAIALTRTMAGGEIGDVAARGAGGVSFFPLLTSHDGKTIAWENKHLTALHRAMGQPARGSGNAFFASNRENAKTLVVNNDAFHRATLMTAIDQLTKNRKDFSELDDTHYDVMLMSLRAAAGIPEPKSAWDQFKEMGGYLLGGIAVFVIGGVGAHMVSKWLDNRGGPKGPGGGGGGGGGQDAFERGFAAGVRAVTGRETEVVAEPVKALPSGDPKASTVVVPKQRSALDMARAVRNFNGGAAPVPGTPGAVAGVNVPGATPALTPVPVTPPVIVPPVAIPAPVVAPRLVPVVP